MIAESIITGNPISVFSIVEIHRIPVNLSDCMIFMENFLSSENTLSQKEKRLASAKRFYPRRCYTIIKNTQYRRMGIEHAIHIPISFRSCFNFMPKTSFLLFFRPSNYISPLCLSPVSYVYLKYTNIYLICQ